LFRRFDDRILEPARRHDGAQTTAAVPALIHF